MNTIHLILLNRLKSFNGLSTEQLTGIYLAMNDFATKKVVEYHKREIKEVAKEGLKSFLSMRWDTIILRIRKAVLKRAKKNAQLLADCDNCKVYCIRKSLIGYALLTTRDVDANKKMKVFGKEVTAIKLTATADFVAMPRKK